MKSLAQAIALLEKRRVMTLAGAGGTVPSLASEVAGKPVKGSWWGHPKGKEIFRLSNELADHEDVLLMKLVESKVTFVHRALWPALFRLATDPERVRAAVLEVSAPAKRLLEEVEDEGSLRLDRHAREVKRDAKALKKHADELEAAALALSLQEHTETGAHFTLLRSWRDWAPDTVVKTAGTLTLDDAREEVREACAGLATPLTGVESTKSSRRPR